jgi:riboflavin kinase/FMN adenylyltransferase
VVTFSPHPHEFFSKTPRSLLAPTPEKIRLMESLGIQQLVLLPFDAQLAQLTADEFIQHVLLDRLQVRRLSVGFNFHFGRQRQGSAADLQRVWGDRVNVVTEQTTIFAEGEPPVRISSSNIRTALSQGELDLANALLGRTYNLIGCVGRGQQLGRQLGFPTANLQVHPQKFVPRDGVYAVQVEGADTQPVLGVMNIGVRPTVNGDLSRTIEVHLLDWHGDLYDRELTVHLHKFLRPEKKFASLDQLKAQIEEDCRTALSLHGSTLAQSSV